MKHKQNLVSDNKKLININKINYKCKRVELIMIKINLKKITNLALKIKINKILITQCSTLNKILQFTGTKIMITIRVLKPLMLKTWLIKLKHKLYKSRTARRSNTVISYNRSKTIRLNLKRLQSRIIKKLIVMNNIKIILFQLKQSKYVVNDPHAQQRRLVAPSYAVNN